MPYKLTHVTEYSKTVWIEQHAYMLGCSQGPKGDSGKQHCLREGEPNFQSQLCWELGRLLPPDLGFLTCKLSGVQ